MKKRNRRPGGPIIWQGLWKAGLWDELAEDMSRTTVEEPDVILLRERRFRITPPGFFKGVSENQQMVGLREWMSFLLIEAAQEEDSGYRATNIEWSNLPENPDEEIKKIGKEMARLGFIKEMSKEASESIQPLVRSSGEKIVEALIMLGGANLLPFSESTATSLSLVKPKMGGRYISAMEGDSSERNENLRVKCAILSAKSAGFLSDEAEAFDIPVSVLSKMLPSSFDGLSEALAKEERRSLSEITEAAIFKHRKKI